MTLYTELVGWNKILTRIFSFWTLLNYWMKSDSYMNYYYSELTYLILLLNYYYYYYWWWCYVSHFMDIYSPQNYIVIFYQYSDSNIQLHPCLKICESRLESQGDWKYIYKWIQTARKLPSDSSISFFFYCGSHCLHCTDIEGHECISPFLTVLSYSLIH